MTDVLQAKQTRPVLDIQSTNDTLLSTFSASASYGYKTPALLN